MAVLQLHAWQETEPPAIAIVPGLYAVGEGQRYPFRRTEVGYTARVEHDRADGQYSSVVPVGKAKSKVFGASGASGA